MLIHHVHALAPYYLAARPASVIAHPTILAFSIFGNLGGSVLAAEALGRVWHLARSDPLPWRHPASAQRMIAAGLALSLLLYIGPDAVVFVSWPDVTPATRQIISLINRWCDFLGFIPLASASLFSVYAQPTISFQLRREPIPVHLWPSWQALRRPLWIGLLLALASAALSFGR